MIVYKYTRERFLEPITREGTLAFPLVDQLNDPYESSFDAMAHYVYGNGVRIPVKVGFFEVAYGFFLDIPGGTTRNYNELLTAFRTEVGILSLTRDPANVLMWAHYAENSSGICIGLDSEHAFFTRSTKPQDGFNLPDTLFRLSPVKYVRKRPKLSLFDRGDYFAKLMFAKYKRWSYEQEYRLLRPVRDLERRGGVAVDRISPLGIREIIVGLKGTIELRQRAIEMARALPNCRYREITYDQNEYALALSETPPEKPPWIALLPPAD